MKASSFSIFLITFSIISSGCLDESQDSGFWGTELNPPAPTPNFQLTNQHNESINLTSFEGNVLVVSFIFTHCSDTCLPTTHLLKNLSTSLGPDLDTNVSIISISVDPFRDTPAVLTNFTLQNNVTWPHLTGNWTSLKPVWDDFGIWVVPQNSESNNNTNYNVLHNPAVFILDKDLRKRSLFTGIDWSPTYLVHDIEIILQE